MLWNWFLICNKYRIYNVYEDVFYFKLLLSDTIPIDPLY